MSNTPQAIEAFIGQFLLPDTHSRGNLPDPRLPDPYQPDLYTVRKITVPDILICGHSSRDARCGITGLLLLREFRRQDARHPYKFRGARRPSFVSNISQAAARSEYSRIEIKTPSASIISHIGGHAFAGNVIIYIPPHWQLPNGKTSPLAGKGVWYGRVEPKHVEGIYKETVIGGKVIKELFRGGVGQGGEILRL